MSISIESFRQAVAEMSIDGTGLEAPVAVKVYPGSAFISWQQNGVTKRITTNRKGLELIRAVVTAALENPNANLNGVNLAKREY